MREESGTELGPSMPAQNGSCLQASHLSPVVSFIHPNLLELCLLQEALLICFGPGTL